MTSIDSSKQPARKWMRWLAVLAWMAVIFYFSSNPNSNEATKQVFGDINFYVRKLAHITEYAILFTLIRWSFATTHESAKEQMRRSLVSLVISVLYACSDEYHQSFVPGRSASVGDVLIDSIGICTATLVSLRQLLFQRNRIAARSDGD